MISFNNRYLHWLHIPPFLIYFIWYKTELSNLTKKVGKIKI